MASSLESPHWESLPSETRQLLETVGAFSFCRRFYLGGGTALALRLGHRISRDLDFFSESDEVGDDTRKEILRHLRDAFSNYRIITNAPGDLTTNLLGRDVGFYSYGYELLEPCDEAASIRIASLSDIGAMKLDAIAGRGARRDFYDVYFLAQHIPLEIMFERAQEKYPHARDFAMMVMPRLNDFRYADTQEPVES
ncbi:MAG: nucleotidyl transferase AbiEii/AbiGii toxin family protein, partial [Chloroflexi bacterium]|nr:nucleotidyl transferase AbiEii/AbiGii toxin family protein [Chloroflexota bacterium]